MSESKAYSTGQFCWHECGTRDAGAAKKFYTELIGWQAKDVPMPGTEGGTYTLFQLDGKDIAGLYEMKGPQFENVPPHWLGYICTEDIDASVGKSASLGGQTMAAPFEVPGVGRMSVMQDPTGAVFALLQLSEHPGEARLGNVPGTFCWNELVTRDIDRAGSYYTNLLPWKPEAQEMPNGAYTMFKMGDAGAGGMMAMGPQFGDLPSHWMPYVTVSDCAATAKKTTSLGGEVVHPTTDIGFGKFAVLQDPTGAVFSVFEFKPES
jgi:predicted enzyme related to lactoylglutathione lyase